MKRSRFIIRSVIKRFSNAWNVINTPRLGHSEKLTKREKRKIIDGVKNDHATSSSEIAVTINEDFNKNIY